MEQSIYFLAKAHFSMGMMDLRKPIDKLPTLKIDCFNEATKILATGLSNGTLKSHRYHI